MEEVVLYFLKDEASKEQSAVIEKALEAFKHSSDERVLCHVPSSKMTKRVEVSSLFPATRSELTKLTLC